MQRISTVYAVETLKRYMTSFFSTGMEAIKSQVSCFPALFAVLFALLFAHIWIEVSRGRQLNRNTKTSAVVC